MSSKIRVLWHSDSSVATNSGFGKVSLEILSRLSASDKYEIAELGIGNYTGEGYKTEPSWKIYLSDKSLYSKSNFVEVVRDFKPQVVVSLLDAHMSEFINNLEVVPEDLRRTFKGIAHMPIDGGPLDEATLEVAAEWDYLVPIHPFGYEELTKGFKKLSTSCLYSYLTLRNSITEGVDEATIVEANILESRIKNYDRILGNIKTINHGVDLSTYYPCELEEKLELRSKFNIPKDAFVFIHVGRNSPRKQQPTVIQAFAEVLRKYPRSILIMGCKVVDIGWDLKDIVTASGANPNNIMFTNNSSDVASEGLSNSDIADLYRASDCHISAACGGGFELTHLESAACGLPQIGVKGAGSITSMVEGKGILVPADAWYLGGQYGLSKRPMATPHNFANAMKNMISSKKRDEWRAEAIRSSKQEEFNWDYAAQKFSELIDEATR